MPFLSVHGLVQIEMYALFRSLQLFFITQNWRLTTSCTMMHFDVNFSVLRNLYPDKILVALEE